MSGISLVGGAIELTHDGRTWRYESPAALAQRVGFLEALAEHMIAMDRSEIYCPVCCLTASRHAIDCQLWPLLPKAQVPV